MLQSLLNALFGGQSEQKLGLLNALFGGQSEQKLEIARPHLLMEMSTKIEVPRIVRGDQQFQEEVAYFQKAISEAGERFGKLARQAVKRSVREANASLIARLAAEKHSSRALRAMCTDELALAVEVHRRRAACKELQRIQSAAKATGDKKLKRQAAAAAKKAAKAGFSWGGQIFRPTLKAIFGWPFL